MSTNGMSLNCAQLRLSTCLTKETRQHTHTHTCKYIYRTHTHTHTDGWLRKRCEISLCKIKSLKCKTDEFFVKLFCARVGQPRKLKHAYAHTHAHAHTHTLVRIISGVLVPKQIFQRIPIEIEIKTWQQKFKTSRCVEGKESCRVSSWLT